MGNEICCQENTSQQRKQEMYIGSLSPEQNQFTPKLSDDIQHTLQKEQPFYEEFGSQPDTRIKKYGADVYEGPLDLINRPTNIGKMYKENGAFFIGNFSGGKADGKCFYVMPDGSYYKGQMKDNIADCQKGSFTTKDVEYVGGFKNNNFHGKGVQNSKSKNYSFEGLYEDGKKKRGTMIWGKKSEECQYDGQFDEQGKFTGRGKLRDPEGVYEGQFKSGIKHGQGIYDYETKLRYVGSYQNGQKNGEGTLFNNDKTIAYKGVFKNGMPNGKGIATSKNGTEFETTWVDGIDTRLL